MGDWTPNIPAVVAEVRDKFEQYEQALIDKNVDVLDPYPSRKPGSVEMLHMYSGHAHA